MKQKCSIVIQNVTPGFFMSLDVFPFRSRMDKDVADDDRESDIITRPTEGMDKKKRC